ncbi:response regulator [Polymorphospora rubra]|uniref:DNA-binding response regulator n=1 Tax=Polymorphospora rubra TaxID=338584 RepID=A0A810N4L9_9ACTN|nr:response regulator transcription factor [Polymorphospora rubra]BCJ68671.1 DNA-binding response regulator [Polymorphospora rubra]
MTAPVAADPIRVALADDHALFREGIRELLSTDDGFVVVGEAATGDQAVAVAVQHRPDVLLLDVEMPGPGAAAVIRQVHLSRPQTRVIVLTMHDDDSLMREVFDSGAAAYLTKAILLDELLAAARSVCRDAQTVLLSVSRRTLGRFGGQPAGGRVAPGAAGPAGDRSPTAREREILRLVAAGMSNAAIAGRLGVTQATVKRHLTNIYAKLDARSRVDAVRRAVAAGIIVADGESGH